MRPYVTWMLVFAVSTAPALVQAGNTTQPDRSPAVQLRNVELSEKGELLGQVLTESGKPGLATISVHSQKDARTVVKAIKTDEKGQFNVQGLKNGRCILTVGKDTFACRVWNHGTAPPKSLQTIAVVPSSGVVLGQNCNQCEPRCGLRQRIACMTGAQKALLVGVIAAAIIIPIVLDDDDAS